MICSIGEFFNVIDSEVHFLFKEFEKNQFEILSIRIDSSPISNSHIKQNVDAISLHNTLPQIETENPFKRCSVLHPLSSPQLFQGPVVFDSQREFAEFQIYG